MACQSKNEKPEWIRMGGNQYCRIIEFLNQSCSKVIGKRPWSHPNMSRLMDPLFSAPGSLCRRVRKAGEEKCRDRSLEFLLVFHTTSKFRFPLSQNSSLTHPERSSLDFLLGIQNFEFTACFPPDYVFPHVTNARQISGFSSEVGFKMSERFPLGVPPVMTCLQVE